MKLQLSTLLRAGLIAAVCMATTHDVMAVAMKSSPAYFNNTIYIGSDDGYLYACDASTWDYKWTYQTQGPIVSSPAIATDGTIHFGSQDRYIYALNPNGTRKWRYLTGDAIVSSPAIGSDGTIYIGSHDSYLYAINPNGTLKWRYSVGSYVLIDSSPVIGSDGAVIILDGNVPSLLHAVNPTTGQYMWRKAVRGLYGSNPLVSPAIGPDGTIYVPSTGGNGGIEGAVAAYSSTGVFKWGYTLGSYAPFQYMESSISIGADGTIYFTGEAEDEFGSSHYYLFAYTSLGLRWKFPVRTDEKTYNSTPCIDVRGDLIFGAYAPGTLGTPGDLYFVDSDGNKEAGGTQDSPTIQSSPIVFWSNPSGQNGLAYGTSGGLAVGFRQYGPVLHTWSSFRGNLRNTANYADVYINVPAETVSAPQGTTGPSSGSQGQQLDWFYPWGSISSYGRPVQYLIDWGDGSNSGWIPAASLVPPYVSHTWTGSGTFLVSAQARSAYDASVVSAWSPSLSVVIAPAETVSTPSTPSGASSGTQGQSYSYSTGGSSSSFGSTVQYLIDWGDGSNSGWLPVGTTSAAHKWTWATTFWVTAQARSANNTAVVSAWAPSTPVAIAASSSGSSWSGSAYSKTFDNPAHVQLLRQYRDQILKKHAQGNAYVTWLYKNSEKALALVLRSSELRMLAGSIANKHAVQIENALNGRPATIADTKDILTFCDLVTKEDKGELGVMARNVKKMIQDGMKSGKPVFGVKFTSPTPPASNQPPPRAPGRVRGK